MRDKQIKEMAKDIKVAHDEQRYLTSDKSIKAISEYLYNAGYRKASDVAREIFEEIEDVINNIGYFDEIDFRSLKKKYESEKE